MKISCCLGILKLSRTLFVSCFSRNFFIVTNSCLTFSKAFTCLVIIQNTVCTLTNIFKTVRHVEQIKENKFHMTSSMYLYFLQVIGKDQSQYAGLCSCRAQWPLVPNFCPRVKRKFQNFHTNHMLGTLDFTVSEHWAPVNFPQSTALSVHSIHVIV